MSTFADLVVSYLKKLFGLPAVVLEWPAVLHSLIIPFLLFSYALKLLLENMRIFYSPTINWIIAFVISFAVLLFITQIGPFAAGLSIFMICLFKLHGVKGVSIGLGLCAAYILFIHPLLITYLA